MQERFSSAFKDAAIGMALVGTDGQWLQVNPALCALVGYTERELSATTFQAITHPDDLDADLEFVRQMLAGEIPTYHMEKRYFHKQGQIVWILLSVSLVRDPVGQPLYFIGQIQDITERKQVQEKLRESEARLRAILDNSPTMVYLKDTEGRYLLVNHQFETAFHLTSKDIAGKTDEEIFPPNRPQRFVPTIGKSSKPEFPCDLKKSRCTMMDLTPVWCSSFRYAPWTGARMPCAALPWTLRSAHRLRRRSERVKRVIASSLS
ncbi:MAG TPA: PAS domain S-box protein [Nitrospiraceae bacterium]|nr:PAS domain S-box protein [Nitrospiraceae bacterium]